MRKHFNELLVLLNENKYNIDILILSEINIKKEELSFYQIIGYNIHTREISRGGGILIYAKNGLNFDARIVNTEAVETLHGQIKYGKCITHVIATYRPPAKNKITFIQQLGTIVKSIPVLDNVVSDWGYQHKHPGRHNEPNSI